MNSWKRYLIGIMLGVTAIASVVLGSMTHTLEGIFVGWWFGTALGYLGVCEIYDQYEYNRRVKKDMIKSDEDLLCDEAKVDELDYQNIKEIKSNHHYATTYIQRLIDNKSEKVTEPKVVEPLSEEAKENMNSTTIVLPDGEVVNMKDDDNVFEA